MYLASKVVRKIQTEMFARFFGPLSSRERRYGNLESDMSLLIKNARIVDGSQPEPTDPVNIAVENGKFVDVGDDVDFDASEILDVSGKFVMPGLIDCHVHVIAAHADLGFNAEQPDSWIALRAAGLMRDMLMRGFTTVRDLGGADRGLQMAIEDGLIEAPRLVICGKALSQTGGHTDYRGPFSNRDVGNYAYKLGTLGRICDGVPEVQRAARDELRRGAQFIKVMADGGVSSPSDPVGYKVFSLDELKAIQETASNFGTYVAAHLYADSAIVRALDCGIECIEHGCLISDETARRVASEGKFVVPTTVAHDALWRRGAEVGFPPESMAKLAPIHKASLESLSRLHAAGVTMGFGTDLLGATQPEQSFEFIIRGRYMPAEAVIRSATIDAAKVLRMESEIGTISAGAHADLIVVDGNPLKDLKLLTEQGAFMPLIMQGGQIKKKSASL